MKYYLTICFSILSIFVMAQFAPIQKLNDLIEYSKTEYVDINGDGAEDIISISTEKGQLVWIENIQGTGSFQDLQPLLPLQNIKKYIIMDLDTDGDIDIVILTEEYGIIYYINNGEEIFSSNIIENDLGDSCELNWNATDIDNDGLIDLIVSGYCITGIGWYKNLGSSFSEFISIDEYNIDYSLFSLDFDLDGDMDIMGYRLETFYFLENLDGNGTFSEAEEFITGIKSLRSLEILDLNNDGYPDLLYSMASTIKKIVWQQNNGNGTFASQVTIFDGYQPRDATTIDMDGDGDFDVIASFYQDDLLAWFENIDGVGTLSEANIISTDIEYFDIYTSDIDNDGMQDFFVTSYYNNLIGWLKNEDGQGTFSSIKPVSFNGFSTHCTISNIDNESGMDILYNSPFGMTYLKNLDGQRHFSTINLAKEDSPKAKIVSTEDINGDGHIDIIALDSIQNPDNPAGILGYKLVWFENDGQSNFFPRNVINEEKYKFYTKGDIDQDGDIDIIASTGSYPGFLYLFENLDGLGNYSSPQVLFNDPHPTSIFLKDINGDNFPDIIMNIGSPTELVWFENIAGTNTFDETVNVIATTNSYKDIFIAQDFDYDGDIDILYANSDNNFYLYKNQDGLGNFSTEILIIENGDPIGEYILHDVDSDNFLDIIYAVSGYGILRIHLQESPGVFSDFIEYDGHSNVDFIQFADIDGDGDQDLMSNNGGNLVFRQNISNNSVITGSVYWDENENGSKDNTEIDLFLQEVEIKPSAIYEFTTPNGQFQFPVEPGENTLSCTPSSGWGFLNNTDSIAYIEALSNNDTIVHDFGLVLKDTIIQVSGDLTSAPTRCGFTVPFWLTYENQSPLYMDGLIHLTFDSLLFENDTVNFQSVIPAPDSIVGLSGYWHLNNLPSTHQQQIEFSIEIPGADFLGEYFNISMDILATTSDNSALADTITHLYSYQINCSFDPNDKLVEPSFADFDNYTLFSDSLYYTIRFQNTGTDTAFTIRVEDQLSLGLDFSSFRPLASSHDYVVQLDATGKVVFTFENILLPTEEENEVGSHGFVKFLILPKEGVSSETVVHNTADIYFDYNPPIFTNTVTNILVDQYPIIYDSAQPLCHDSNEGSISISFPPKSFNFLWGNGETGFEINNLTENDYLIEVFNNTGDVVANSTIQIEAPEPLTNAITTTPSSLGSNNGTASSEPSGGTPQYSYVWGTEPVQTSETAINLSAGDYFVTVTDDNDCETIESFTIEQIVSTDELIDKLDFSVLPNPSAGECTIYFKLKGVNSWTIELQNSLGQTSKKYASTKISKDAENLILEDLENGVYFVILTVNNNRLIKKIIVAKN